MMRGKVKLSIIVLFILTGIFMGSFAIGKPVVSATVTEGDFIITGGVKGTDYTYDEATQCLTILSSTEMTLSNSKLSTGYIYIKEGVDANLILSGLNIDRRSKENAKAGITIADDSEGDVTLTIKGMNSIISFYAPAIQKNGTVGKLIFEGDGKIEAKCAKFDFADNTYYGYAAIGGGIEKDSGNIIINGGEIVAYCYSTGAAIGGGFNADGDNITINGGKIRAWLCNMEQTRLLGGASIGGGLYGDGKNITINGGIVDARVMEPSDPDFAPYKTEIGEYADCLAGAGIGGGYGGDAHNIVINGGVINAIGDDSMYPAAAIGAGGNGNATAIQINGGHITATGNSAYGVGIGSGGRDYSILKENEGRQMPTTDVTITGGTIIAKGGGCAPGIGAGEYGNAKIYISGGSVNAIGGKKLWTIDSPTLADDIGIGASAKDCREYTFTSALYHSIDNPVPVSLQTITTSHPKDTDVKGYIEFLKDGKTYKYGMDDVKTDDEKKVYIYLENGVEAKETVFSTIPEETPTQQVVLMFNGSEKQQEWYGGDVRLSAGDYSLAVEKNGIYFRSYTITTSGIKTFYFRHNYTQEYLDTSITVNIKIDKTVPTGIIEADSKKYTYVNNNTSNRVKISDPTISISGTDVESGVDKVEYAISSNCYTTTANIESAALDWKSGNKCSIAMNKEQIVYTKVTDKAGHIAYASTPILYCDSTKPEIEIKQSNVTESSAQCDFKFSEACEYAYVLLEKGSVSTWEDIQSMIQVGYQGKVCVGATVNQGVGTFTNLKPNTDYQVYVCAREVYEDVNGNKQYTYSEGVVTTKITTAKKTISPIEQQIAIKAQLNKTSYKYDIEGFLTARGIEIQQLDNAEYSVSKGDGTILTELPIVIGGILQISVKQNLEAGLSQDINVTIKSDNYNDILLGLNICTVSKEVVTLSGITSVDTVYDGTSKSGYKGTVEWKKDGRTCVDLNGTEVTYVGVDGTDYDESKVAPVNAGKYQIIFRVKSENEEYAGEERKTYTISKVDLSAQMSNVRWYLDGLVDLSVYEDGEQHEITVDGYPENLLDVEYEGNRLEKTPGIYTITAHFKPKDSNNYDVPESVSVNWQIIRRVNPDMSNVHWIYKDSKGKIVGSDGSVELVMSDTPYTVEVAGLPEGVTAQYTGTCTAIKAGIYKAMVTFKVTDTKKYEEPEITSMSLLWSIGKKVASVENKELLIRAGVPGSSYVYDLNEFLTAAKLDPSQMGNLTYNCVLQTGTIISGKITVKNNKIIIPTNGDLADELTQDIVVTFSSDNYEDIRAVLTIRTVPKIITQLTGVQVQNKVYSGKPQGYLGTISWLNDGEECVGATETDVVYIGIKGTNYNSATAPTNAGSYKVKFSVDKDHAEYAGIAEYEFEITKADLTSRMSNVAWYLDDNDKLTSSARCEITEDGEEHYLSVKGYPQDLMSVQYGGIHCASEPGEYTVTASFVLKESVAMNYNTPEELTIKWNILKRVIEKITPDMSNVHWVYKHNGIKSDYNVDSTEFFVDGENYTVEIDGLPEGVTAKYSGTVTANALDEYEMNVTFEVSDKEKYEEPLPASMRLNWSIVKNRCSIPEQTYSIKSGVDKTLYEYNLNNLLTAAGRDVSDFDNLKWNVKNTDGIIMSKAPEVDGNIMTISVKQNLEDKISENILISIESDNFETITTVLAVETTSKTPVVLMGMALENKVYNGQPQGYSGVPIWCMEDGAQADLSFDENTVVYYEGISGTSYQDQTPPINAGKYRIVCKVKENHEEYIGSFSREFTILKADLTSEMQNVAWYLDDKVEIKTLEDAVVTEDGAMHYVGIKGYPEQMVIPRYSETYVSDKEGRYRASVTFELTDEAKMNYNAPGSTSLYWTITGRVRPNMSGVKWVYSQDNVKNNYYSNSTWLYANGKEYTVQIDGLPEGVKATYSGDYKAVSAGNYKAVVHFETTDSKKYKQPYPSTMELSWKIIKNVAHISNQEYVLKSGGSTTQYSYDLMKLFEKSNIDISLIKDMEWSYSLGEGSILSGEPTIEEGIMTIPVNKDLDENLLQKIELTLTTDVYDDIKVTIALRTLSKIPLTLSGVTVENKVYTGEPQGYSGVPVWRDEQDAVCDETDTMVTYIGINGTSYNSKEAPINAGNYQVVFEIHDENQDYSGMETYTFTIQKAELSVDLTSIVWYLDDKQIDTNCVEALYDENIHTVTIGNYPTDYLIPKYQNNEKSEIGKYTTVVKFVLKGEYAMNYKILQNVKLDWSVVSELTQISKVVPDMSMVHWVYSQGTEKMEYIPNVTKLYDNQQAYTVEIAGLPEGVTVLYSGICTSKEKGIYEAVATFNVTDESLYQTPNPSEMKLTWSILDKQESGASGDGANESNKNETGEQPEVGITKEYKDSQYEVTSLSAESGCVEYKAPSKKSAVKEVVIPKTIMIDGKEFQVVSIAEGAFKGCKNLKKIKIKAEVKKYRKMHLADVLNYNLLLFRRK